MVTDSEFTELRRALTAFAGVAARPEIDKVFKPGHRWQLRQRRRSRGLVDPIGVAAENDGDGECPRGDLHGLMAYGLLEGVGPGPRLGS